ncbi:MAG: hypothetical protein WDO18_16015 [Acidobacteriota bacterium]
MSQQALAQILWSQGKTDEAKKLLQDLIDHPTAFVSSEQATITLARLQMTKTPEESRKLLDKLREGRPAVSMAAVELAGQLPPTTTTNGK